MAIEAYKVIRASAMSEPEIQNVSICQHHWVIDSPNGPTSKGVCCACGQEREFQNYLEEYSFGKSPYVRAAGNSRSPSDIETTHRVAGENRDEDLNEGV